MSGAATFLGDSASYHITCLIVTWLLISTFVSYSVSYELAEREQVGFTGQNCWTVEWNGAAFILKARTKKLGMALKSI